MTRSTNPLIIIIIIIIITVPSAADRKFGVVLAVRSAGNRDKCSVNQFEAVVGLQASLRR